MKKFQTHNARMAIQFQQGWKNQSHVVDAIECQTVEFELYTVTKESCGMVFEKQHDENSVVGSTCDYLGKG